MNASEEPMLVIHRGIYNQKRFDAEFSDTNPKIKKSSMGKTLKHLASSCHPKNLLSIFTLLNLFSEYKFRDYLVPDVISGLTVGVLRKLNKRHEKFSILRRAA